MVERLPKTDFIVNKEKKKIELILKFPAAMDIISFSYFEAGNLFT